jgi:hypothetical protein
MIMLSLSGKLDTFAPFAGAIPRSDEGDPGSRQRCRDPRDRLSVYSPPRLEASNGRNFDMAAIR